MGAIFVLLFFLKRERDFMWYHNKKKTNLLSIWVYSFIIRIFYYLFTLLKHWTNYWNDGGGLGSNEGGEYGQYGVENSGGATEVDETFDVEGIAGL